MLCEPLGVWLGTRLQSFNLQEGSPNCIEPGKRRVGPTTHVDGRYIPMMVRREIYERQRETVAGAVDRGSLASWTSASLTYRGPLAGPRLTRRLREQE